MTPSLAWVALAAIILFWAVGAYNRLVRLRSDVVKAFSALDSVLAVQPALIQATLPAALPPDVLQDGSLVQWSRLSSAGEQYARSLANARSRPLDPEAISALCAAQSVLDDVWQIATQPGIDAQAGLMDGLRARLARLADQAAGLREAFDASVFAYNTAVGQFPAMLLARIWGFKPAGLIQPRNTEQNGE
jgi:LemA protein